jgi:hypothetical protein
VIVGARIRPITTCGHRHLEHFLLPAASAGAGSR